MKKLLIILTLLLLVSGYALPVFVFAADTAEPPMDCWTQESCASKGGTWAETVDSRCTKLKDAETRFCYAPPPTVNLQVGIGAINQVKGLTDYIPKVYDYMVAIVSIVAIVMVMVGGLQYLTSGGSEGRITQAKERILGAVIGLFLVLGSYVLLNTINPALTQLKLPPIKMIRTITYTEEGACPEKGDKTSGQSCDTICDCATGSCVGMESAKVYEDFTKIAAGAASIVTLGVGGVAGSVAGAAAKGGTWLVRGSAAMLKQVASFASKNKIATTLIASETVDAAKTGVKIAGAYLIMDALGAFDSSVKKVDNGICVVEANKNVKTGELCQKDTHCISGKCVVNEKITYLVGKWAEGKGVGFCSGGGVGSPCDSDTDCNVGTFTGLKCVDSSDGKMTKRCTDGKAGSDCEKDSDCKDAGYTCGYSKSMSKFKECIKKGIGPATITTTCKSKADCQQGGGAGTYVWDCIRGLCSDGSEGANCCMSAYLPCAGGIKGCKSGYTCAFSANKTWYADDQSYVGSPTNIKLGWTSNHNKHTWCQKSDKVFGPPK